MIGAALGIVPMAVVITENALHIWQRPAAPPEAANSVARETGSTWEPLRVTARDGVALDAWLFTPPSPNGSAVLLMHGVGDTRLGVLGQARFLLRDSFTVLTPDCRGHGASGGDLISYGIQEAGDVGRWADRLFQERSVQRLYGLGESMGASILLESLPSEPRFRAMVAECPFSTFEEVAYDRLEQRLGLGRPASWPVVQIGFLWARLRYGLDLRRASPAAAVRSTHVPILFIHGDGDRNIPLRHSRALHSLNPGATRLWEVPGAGHVSALSAQPDVYARTVAGWFRSHP